MAIFALLVIRYYYLSIVKSTIKKPLTRGTTPIMNQLATLLTPYATRVEAEMRRLVPSLDEQRSFFGQIHYHLGWVNAAYERSPHQKGGKRVRATFCLMACEALIGDIDPALSAAAATEFLHEFTLIHDDIEDGDSSRRHRPTLWTLVGVPQAINAGDGLFTLAQQALLHSQTRGIPANYVLRAQQRLNEVTLNLCIGQHLDMAFETYDLVSPEDYLTMISGKTAALLSFATEVGGLMAQADEATISTLQATGKAVGLAFQIFDDLLGIWGDSKRTGKPVGADIRAKKKSLPVIYALSQPESERLRQLYTTPLNQERQIAEATQLIEKSGAREYVIELAETEQERAIEMLYCVNASDEALQPLHQLIELLTKRDY
jgi:geranylgeranyl diphosphate synthase type I